MVSTRLRIRLLLVAMLVDTLGGGLFAPFELVYGHDVAELSLAKAGLLLSVAAAAGIAIGPVAGVAVDRLGPLGIVAVSNVVGAFGCGVLVLSPGAWTYGVGAFLVGASVRIFWSAFTPLVASIAPAHELERWFGRLRGSRLAGIAAGEALSGLALSAGHETGLRAIVLLDGLSYIAALALVVLAGRGRRPVRAETGVRPSYRSALADRPNVALAVLNVAATLLIVAPILAMPVFVLDRLRLPSWTPGTFAALLTVTAAGGTMIGGRLVRGRRRLRNLQIADCVWAAGLLLFLVAPVSHAAAFVGLGAAMILLGCAEAFYAPTADALPAALAPPGLQGRYAALHQLAWGVSETIAPLLCAALLALNDFALWSTLALLALASAAVYRALERSIAERDGVAGVAIAAANVPRL
jgi:MFS family permease